MRILKNLLWVSAAIVLGACSSNETVELNPDTPNGFDSEGNGYINISVSMPSGGAGSTRANDDLNDGSEDEYALKNATLLLFTGDDADENKATFAAAYSLTLTWNEDYDNDQITKQGYQTQKITNDNKRYKFAMVVLNKNNLFNVNADNQTIDFGGENATKYGENGDKTLTFLQFSQHVVSGGETKFYSADGKFYMANAVLSDKPGNKTLTTSSVENANVAKGTTLTLVEDAQGKSKIYKTKEAAANGEAVHIIVERGVAKVQLTCSDVNVDVSDVTVNDLSNTATSGNAANNILTASSSNVTWALRNKNNVSYLVRNWNQTPYTASVNAHNENLTTYGDAWFPLHSDGDLASGQNLGSNSPLNSSATGYNAYRFAGYNAIKIKTPSVTDVGVDPDDCYRTYWGVDPNYNTDLGNDVYKNTNGNEDAFVSPNTQYCFENTFDVAHQQQKNTTEAMIKVQFQLPSGKSTKENGGEGNNTFYILNGSRKIVYNKADLEKAIKTATEISKYVSTTEGSASVVTIAYGVKDGTNVTEISEANKNTDACGTIVINSVTITNAKSDVSVGTGTDADTKSDNTVTLGKTAIGKLNDKFVIDRYYDGYAYYPVLIKHFSDDLTPWTESTKTNGKAYAEASGASDANGNSANSRWLGRYGVLRNNWYLLNITDINNIGYPDEPTPDETTDDEVESWINVRVSMLSWAKRQQDIKL